MQFPLLFLVLSAIVGARPMPEVTAIEQPTLPIQPPQEPPSATFVQTMRDVGRLGKDSVRLAGHQISRGFQSVGKSLSHSAQSTGQIIHHSAKNTGQVIQNSAQTTGNGLKHAAQVVGNGIKTGGQKLVGGVVATGHAIESAASKTAHSISNGWHHGLGRIDKSVNSLDARIQQKLNN